MLTDLDGLHLAYSQALQYLLQELGLTTPALLTAQLSLVPKAAEKSVTKTFTTVGASWLGMA
jgi:hypothetical protein